MSSTFASGSGVGYKTHVTLVEHMDPDEGFSWPQQLPGKKDYGE